MQTKKFLSLLLALAMMFSLSVTASAAEEGESLEGSIVILHTNDVHGGIAGYAKVAALKAEYQAKGAYTLLLDAGDYIQGDPTVSVSQGKTAIELMNLAGYDAATIGNHEFDYGYANFKEITKDAKFPVVAANVLVNGKAENTHVIFGEEGGKKIGIFGLSTPETATKAHPAKIQGVTFPAGKDMFAIARAEVKALEDEGCDYIVCLGHLGIDDESKGNRSIDLMDAVEGIDLFIDGHSHSTLEEVKEAAGDKPITSTGTKLANIGVVTISAEGEIAMENVSAEGLAEDKDIAARAAAIQKQIDDDYGAAFAKTEVLLNGDKDPGNRTEETNLGDLITDALVWGAKKNGEEVDAAVTNGGGIRAPIAAGGITKKDVNTVLPFGNTLSIVKVTGAELLEALGDRRATLCRELTKRFETVMPTTLSQALAFYEKEEPRGEYVLVVAGRDREELRQEEIASWESMSIAEHMEYYERQGMDGKAAMKQVARDRGVGKREIYAKLHGLEQET